MEDGIWEKGGKGSWALRLLASAATWTEVRKLREQRGVESMVHFGTLYGDSQMCTPILNPPLLQPQRWPHAMPKNYSASSPFRGWQL